MRVTGINYCQERQKTDQLDRIQDAENAADPQKTMLKMTSVTL